MLVFTNFVAGLKLVALLGSGQKAEIEIVGPAERVKRLDVREDSSKWLLAKSRLCAAGMRDQIAIRRWHCDRRLRFCDMTLSATI